MASFSYFIRTTSKDSDKDVKIRARFSAYYDKKQIVTHGMSGVAIPKKIWDIKKCCVKGEYNKDDIKNGLYKKTQDTLDEINQFVDKRYKMLGGMFISSEWLQDCIDEYWAMLKQMIEDEKKAVEEIANKETLIQYIKRYQQEIKNGGRLTNKNTLYKITTIKAVKASMVQFAEYQKSHKLSLNFDDIDLAFYRKYTAWLTRKGYAVNSIGKCIKDLKNILNNAKDDGLHYNEAYKNKKFKVIQNDTDNIYLTQKELNAISELDLSSMAKGYSDARDVFLMGCCLAQRVGDYNHLSPDNVVIETEKRITEKNEVVEIEVVYILITQEKTGARVKIPANLMTRGLLTKHSNQLPYIWEQKLNQYIKVIARKAGITGLEQISTTKGGECKTEFIEKCELVKSHTARRTGATLMYLSGMDLYDICRITGHASIKNLRKYIKADELVVAQKINKYDYFN